MTYEDEVKQDLRASVKDALYKAEESLSRKEVAAEVEAVLRTYGYGARVMQGC